MTPTSPSASPSATAAVPTADQLRALARAGADKPYHAVYRVHRTKPSSTAKLVVEHTSQSVRVDVTTGKTTATLIVTPRASYACSKSKRDRACFRVAKAGKPVRPPFNLAPQTVFTSDVGQLAAHPGHYRVRAAGTREGGTTVPAAICFDVRPRASASKRHAPAGAYCFAPSGVLTAVTYRSGNSLRLLSVRLKRPPHKVFKPYATPTPLP